MTTLVKERIFYELILTRWTREEIAQYTREFESNQYKQGDERDQEIDRRNAIYPLEGAPIGWPLQRSIYALGKLERFSDADKRYIAEAARPPLAPDAWKAAILKRLEQLVLK